MIRRSVHQCVVVAVLAMSLAAGPALAAPGRLESPSSEDRAWLSPVWDFLSSLLSGGEAVPWQFGFDLADNFRSIVEAAGGGDYQDGTPEGGDGT